MQSLSRFALLACLSAFVVALPAYAAPKSAAPNLIEAVRSPVAKPMSAWLVGPSQASAFDAKDHPDQQGCLMVAEFDNGMIVGIHARKAGIVGMTVDTRQQNLTAGQASTVGLNLASDSYTMDAVATDASTLSLSLDQAGGGKKFVERLTDLGNFRLLIDQKPYYFATTGFTDGLARLQECMGANMTVPVVVTGPGVTAGKITRDTPIETMRVDTAGTKTPLALAMPNLIPTGYRFVLDDVDPMTPISWQPGDDWVNVMRNALTAPGLKMSVKDNVVRISQRVSGNEPVIETQQSPDEQAAETVVTGSDGTWVASAGENLGSVLQTWGMMAGVNVEVDLMGDLVLPRDVQYEGNFNDAVQQLLAQYSGKNKPVTIMTGGQKSPAKAAPSRSKVDAEPAPARNSFTTRTDTWRPRSPVALKAMEKQRMKQMEPIGDTAKSAKAQPVVDETVKKSSKKTASKAPKPSATGTWEALRGTSLRDIFEHWGEKAGVRVVWMTEENYPLPETFKQKGKFEDAVARVLAQYKDQGSRPAGQLNQDPDTGEKALIIKSSAF
jgi:hypothetical protein